MKVFTDLKSRGCEDILIAVTDGLTGMHGGFGGGVSAATTLQTCIVHLLCTSLDYAGWKDRKRTRGGAAPDLHGAERRHGTPAPGGLRHRPLGTAISHHCARRGAGCGPR